LIIAIAIAIVTVLAAAGHAEVPPSQPPTPGPPGIIANENLSPDSSAPSYVAPVQLQYSSGAPSDWPPPVHSMSTPYLTEPIDVDRPPLSTQLFGEPTLADPSLEPLVDQSVVVSTPEERDGIFQGVSFTGTWLAKPAGNDLGWSDLYLDANFGFPLPTRESPLIVTPAFGVTYFDGPTVPDLPARVYDATLEFRWLRRLNDRWAMDVAVQPGVHSDFQSDQSKAFRIAGRGVAIFDWTPTTKIVLGIAYLDRQDVSLLPAAGVIWTPSDDWRFELVAPRPRVAWRVGQCSMPACVEHWAYVAGEFGGGQWAIVRASGADDVATLRDYRVILGLERKVVGGVSGRVEVGYVFGRVLEYASATPDFRPDDTVMLRLGAAY